MARRQLDTIEQALLDEVRRAENRDLIWQRQIALPFCNELIAAGRNVVRAHHDGDPKAMTRALKSLERLVGRR
jgi:hypothetical protein